jgi:ABC-2 type transport system permease protein
VADAAAASRARIWAVIRLEWLTQRREPLTALYVLVFFALACAFGAGGPVELVSGRGVVPRSAPWSIALASSALTAFGQVITTMVAATVVLRDTQDRVHEFIGTTQLSRSEYLFGKLVASLALLCMIYTAIPIGFCVGAAIAGESPMRVLRGSYLPFVMVVLPTMITVGALQFAAGVLSGRLWVIVAQGLVLIWLWTGAIGAIRGTESAILGALSDPFGSAPLLHATATWSDAQRTALPMPVSALLLANRLLWFSIAGTAATIAVLRGGAVRGTPLAPPERAGRESAPIGSVAVVNAIHTAVVHRVSGWRAACEVARYVMRWTLRDTGWRVLTVLAMVNVGVHAMHDVTAARAPVAVSVGAVAALQLHGRLFLILIATIYAGELVWRERDERSAPFFDALPVRDVSLIGGNVAGVMAAQSLVVALLTLAAAVFASVSARALPDVSTLLSEAATRVLLPAIAWLLAALAVHVFNQQKLVGHLLCIAGWAVASVFWNAAVPARSAATTGPAWSMLLLSLLGCAAVLSCCWRRGGTSRAATWIARWRR